MTHNGAAAAVLLGLAALAAVGSGPSAAAPSGRIQGHWIWAPTSEVQPYNQTIVARRRFRAQKPSGGTLRITADSFYRLYVNGEWVNDGPCRAWPEHYQYDELEVGPYLRDGENEIRVVARYFGTGDFHRVPQQPGLLADLHLRGAREQVLRTDASWEAAEAPAWKRETPKVSIQMEPAELYDARLEDDLRFKKVRVICAAGEGPWKDLNPRDVPPLTRHPMALRAYLGARVVKADGLNYCLPAARLANPRLIEANIHASCAGGMATLLETQQGCDLRVQTENMVVAVNGQQSRDGRWKLPAGRHLVLAFVRNIFGHDKEKAVRFMEPAGFRLVNPSAAAHENPWVYLRFKEFALARDDMLWGPYEDEDPKLKAAKTGYAAEMSRLLGSVKTPADLADLRGRVETLSTREMFVEDVHWQFRERQVVAGARARVEQPGALMSDTPAETTVHPSEQGDVELLYDLGEQNVGYYAFDLTAGPGVAVDLFSLEYITPDGTLQHSFGNRNGMRFITRAGVNRFVSLKRRSGRYVFVTLRGMREPVRIRNLRLIESTYPVNQEGSFTCSDARLDRIWEISTRTLKLCMEDTYTDCPLYEQTHWVGDARNESLLAYPVFGAPDLARRCIRITAQSLERYPIAGCQTPSGWDVLIPAWAFLWGISVWDHYWYTGDPESVREFWPAVIRNLRGAEKFVTDRDLFSAPWWNFFDWTPLDQNQRTVLHNSLILVGAIDAALKLGTVLGDRSQDAWLRSLRGRLVAAIRRLWDPARGAYPDALRADGSTSPVVSQHTSFLAALYDVAGREQEAAIRRNLVNPPAGMVRVGSPFAALYHYDALDKLGLDEEVLKEIYRNYLPMLEAGATTVWESFPTGTTGGGRFPTRSHCHAWSSAPNHYLPRLLLGFRQEAAGAARVTISPRLSGLTWARGDVVTTRGKVAIAWRLEGDTVHLTVAHPEGMQVGFTTNPSLSGKKVLLNGKPVS